LADTRVTPLSKILWDFLTFVTNSKFVTLKIIDLLSVVLRKEMFMLWKIKNVLHIVCTLLKVQGLMKTKQVAEHDGKHSAFSQSFKPAPPPPLISGWDSKKRIEHFISFTFILILHWFSLNYVCSYTSRSICIVKFKLRQPCNLIMQNFIDTCWEWLPCADYRP
jgi:hypothetical protein